MVNWVRHTDGPVCQNLALLKQKCFRVRVTCAFCVRNLIGFLFLLEVFGHLVLPSELGTVICVSCVVDELRG